MTRRVSCDRQWLGTIVRNVPLKAEGTVVPVTSAEWVTPDRRKFPPSPVFPWTTFAGWKQNDSPDGIDRDGCDDFTDSAEMARDAVARSTHDNNGLAGADSFGGTSVVAFALSDMSPGVLALTGSRFLFHQRPASWRRYRDIHSRFISRPC